MNGVDLAPKGYIPNQIPWCGLRQALARGAKLPGGEAYAAAASRLRATLRAQAWDGRRLARAFGPGAPARDGVLEDYAYLARALLDLEGPARAADLELAAALAHAAWKRFHDGTGWRLGDDASTSVEELLGCMPADTPCADLPTVAADPYIDVDPPFCYQFVDTCIPRGWSTEICE